MPERLIKKKKKGRGGGTGKATWRRLTVKTTWRITVFNPKSNRKPFKI